MTYLGNETCKLPRLSHKKLLNVKKKSINRVKIKKLEQSGNRLCSKEVMYVGTRLSWGVLVTSGCLISYLVLDDQG